VLGNLSAGVLAFDADGCLRATNARRPRHPARRPGRRRGPAAAAWTRHAELRDAIAAGCARHSGEWQREIEMQNGAGVPQALLLRGTAPAGGDPAPAAWWCSTTSPSSSAQRSAAWGEVARRLAHEIKNPLTPIQLSAERLQHKLADKLGGDEREMLRARRRSTIVNQVEAMKHMVNDFRDYARLPPPQLGALDLNALVEDVLLACTKPLRCPHGGAGRQPAARAGDAAQLRQVIHNLVANAEDALGAKRGAGDPRRPPRAHGKARARVLSVSDNGGGFPEGNPGRAFEPYVTTKARGTGLGLAIVKKIVDEHHGEIEIANARRGRAASPSGCPAARTERLNHGKILVVDDEVGIRELLSEILRDEGHDDHAGGERRAAHAARKSAAPGPGAARHLDARHRRHHAAQGMVGGRPAHHAGGDDVRPRHHRHGGRGHAHRRAGLLEKPIALQKLLAAVKRALQKSVAAPRRSELTLAAFGRSGRCAT
jgi:hypothetical protein